MKNTATPPPLDRLLGSRLRARVLAWLFTHPADRYFVRQLALLLQEDSTNLSRELAQLERLGIVRAAREGQQKYFQVDPGCPIFAELSSLVRKTAGIEQIFREALAALADRIDAAFVFGSVAAGREGLNSDVDLLVIGDVRLGDLVEALGSSQDRLGREVNPVVYSRRELQDKLAARHHFVTSVWEGPKLMVLGSPGELDRLAQVRMAG